MMQITQQSTLKTKEHFQQEYERICLWRSLWNSLASDDLRARKHGFLQTRQERILRRALIANARVAGLMAEFDLLYTRHN